MIQHVVGKLNFGKKLPLIVTAVLAVTVFVLFGVSNTPAQTVAAAVDISGTWQGTLVTQSQGLRTIVKISKIDSGSNVADWKAVMYSIDQGGQPIPVTSVALQGADFKFVIVPLDLVYTGTLSADAKTITGKSTQYGHTFKLDLTRTTPENAWSIVEPLKPMEANAHPVFDVVTIKPSQTPQGRATGLHGRHVIMVGGTLEGLIETAYKLQAKQILNAPEWFSSYRFDIDGVADIPGRPSQAQINEMFQQLLADRFKLVFHKDKQELSVYAITVAKGGPKITKPVLHRMTRRDFSSQNSAC